MERGSAAPFVAAVDRLTADRCLIALRQVAAANVHQFVFERWAEITRSPEPVASDPASREETTPLVWRGREGERMRDAIVDLALEGRLALADFGDFPPDEVAATLQTLPEFPANVSRIRVRDLRRSNFGEARRLLGPEDPVAANCPRPSAG